MPSPRIHVADPASSLAARLAALPDELGIVAEFPPAALAEAHAVAADPPLPDDDALDLDFVTLDPAGSRDLDQALHLERNGDGWIVHYAIADVPAFVALGGPLDAETRRRGQTMYAPDRRIPLHPDEIGEGAASLLPDQVRGAFVWTFELAPDGSAAATTLRRARVRSRARLDYPSVQADLDANRATGSIALLPEVGRARQALALARGGASLQSPETEVVPDGSGCRLERRTPLPVEGWNAELSLLTGMEAARIMLDGGVGILRTMPPAEPSALDRFRRQTVALGVPWAPDEAYGTYLARLDPTSPATAAILHAAAALFRGATYTPFDGAPPAQTEQAAIAAPYAHVTAPLRRLVDRFGLLVCEALTASRVLDPAVRAALPELPAAMAASGSLAGRLDRAAVDTVEAAVLASRVGDVFDAVVIAAGQDHGTVQLADPAVTAECDGALEPGAAVRVGLIAADPQAASVRFALA